MPYFSMQTNKNLSTAEIDGFLQQASKTIAHILQKPESYVMVALPEKTAMLFAGNSDPCAYLQLKSLGLPDQKTSDMSARLCSLVNDCFGIDPARVYIEFSSPPRNMWGWDKTTF